MWPKPDTDLAAWIGHLGGTTTKWDNGFYAYCSILGVSVAFIFDRGSTAIIVSTRVFQSINKEKRPSMVPMKDKIRGANGSDIEVLDLADIPLELGRVCFFQTAIVSSILRTSCLSLQVALNKRKCW